MLQKTKMNHNKLKAQAKKDHPKTKIIHKAKVKNEFEKYIYHIIIIHF